MKKILFVFSIALFIFSSCTKEELIESQDSNREIFNFEKSAVDCGEAVTYDLIAGQHIDIGTVSVNNDDENLYVTLETEGDWYLNETHLYVGADEDIPLNKQGNPRFGHFPYHGDHDLTQSYTFTVPLENLDECFSVVAHAEAFRIIDGEVVQDETAFGCGDKTFPGNRWGCYFEYCKQTCEPACEPAYAYHDGCGFCSVDDGSATYTNEIAYGSLVAWNYILIDLLVNVDGCDLSDAIKVGYLRVSVEDEATGKLLVKPFVYPEYEVCDVTFFLDNDANAAMVPGTNYFNYSYDPATSTPASFEVTWPDTTQNIFIRGGVSITPAD